MDELITSLIKRHKTNCPFRISRELGIHIRFDDLGDSTRGIFYRKLRRRFILIHSQLSNEWQRYICAHELGHERLHKGISRFFLDEHSYFSTGKVERQANHFAVKLLTAGAVPDEGESVGRFLQRNDVPAEMHEFYMK